MTNIPIMIESLIWPKCNDAAQFAKHKSYVSETKMCKKKLLNTKQTKATWFIPISMSKMSQKNKETLSSKTEPAKFWNGSRILKDFAF